MNFSIPPAAIPDHFVDANKMVKTASEPYSQRQENGRFANFNSIEFDGIKPLEFERFRITTHV